jgi:hypothetical protein
MSGFRGSVEANFGQTFGTGVIFDKSDHQVPEAMPLKIGLDGKLTEFADVLAV